MKRNHYHKRANRKYDRRLAAAFIGAALLSTASFSPVASAAVPDLPTKPAVSSTKPLSPLNKNVDRTRSAKSIADQVKLDKETANAPIKTSYTAKKAVKQQNQSKAAANKNQESSNQAAPKAKEIINVTATAYAPGAHDNGKWGNKTHLGTQVRPGVIAVDPNVIPLGSSVYIEFPNGQGMHAIAEDTGGAIKGNRIDIAKWSVSEAEDFGIQTAKVHILSRGNA
ncbi:3D domain-containing protein [Dendrosporobacter sp. 1207_IL3150]|uniref:3D domain-containing protein n=1 Tax=Dendrosporobacter sp. 1207_IL3150 TaxID=3084054 RepID=UPI002FDA61AB